MRHRYCGDDDDRAPWHRPDGVAAVVCHVVGGDEHEDDGEVFIMQIRGHSVQQHRGPDM